MEKLNCKSLMIGDWVCYRGTNIRVTSLYDKGGSNEVGWGLLESTWVNGLSIEPILLTSETLEKNGWRYDKSACTWVNDDIGIHLEDGFDGNEFWWKAGVNHITPINYVHQFQHVLKICGIEKEIEL